MVGRKASFDFDSGVIILYESLRPGNDKMISLEVPGSA